MKVILKKFYSQPAFGSQEQAFLLGGFFTFISPCRLGGKAFEVGIPPFLLPLNEARRYQ